MFNKLDLSLLFNCFEPRQSYNGVLTIETPYTFSDGDTIYLYVTSADDDLVRVSDGAATFKRSSYSRDVKSYFSKHQILLLQKAASDYGAVFDVQTGEFYSEVGLHEINRAAFSIASSTISASTFIYLMHALGSIGA